MNINTLRAQALAIVMVVLVVASIIGMAMFSRMAKDKRLAVEEQNSAAASQAAEGILDVLVGADIDKLEAAIADDTINMPIEGFGGIKAFIESKLGLASSAAALPDDRSWCPGAASGDENTYIKLSIEETEPEDYPEVKPGSVRAYNLQGATINPPCTLRIRIRALDNQAVFAVKKVYDPTEGVADEFNGYFAFPGGSVNASDLNSDEVDPYTSLNAAGSWNSTESSYEFPLINLFDEYNAGVREIRFLPLSGVIGISTEIVEDPACVSKSFYPVKVIADANCQTSSNAYEMVLPGSGNLGYAPLFDFGIYDNGDFRLKH